MVLMLTKQPRSSFLALNMDILTAKGELSWLSLFLVVAPTCSFANL